MLHLIYGTDWQQNADALLSTLCHAAAQGEERQILIVPEQFSFDCERRLCERGGDSISLYAEVLSFTRLYDRVCATVGGGAAGIMDKSGRLIAMAGALEQIRSRLKIYGVHITKPEFLSQLLALYEEFRSYGADREALSRVQPELTGMLAEKLAELGEIFESYDAVCAGAAHDPATRLTRLAELLHTSEFAAGRSVWIDGFTDFTEQELAVIETLLAAAKQVTVSLCCDRLQDGADIYSVPRQTAARLLRCAERCGVEVRRQIVAPTIHAPALAHLRAQLFGANTTVWTEQAPIFLTEGETPWNEVLAAVAGIQALLLQGKRFRQIAVACTQSERYYPVLERLLSACRIPAYFSGTQEILRTPVIRMVLSALRAATGGMEAADVLDYLKSGIAPLSRDDCDRLENYAFTWNLRGSRWDEPFTGAPSGLGGGEPTGKDAELLARLNKARLTAVQPLCGLRRALRGAKTTGAQILALMEFLDTLQLSARLSERAAAQRERGELQRAQQTEQLYEILIGTMEQIYAVLGETTRTPEDFYRFFRAALSQHSVGTIPATLDCVTVGSLRDLRGSRAEELFVLGASDGLLPATDSDAGLLNQTERRRLKRAGLQMAPDEQEQLSRELLCAYQVLTSASGGLWMSCKTGEPSYLYTRLKLLFPNERTLPVQPLPASEVQLASRLAATGETNGAQEGAADALRTLRQRADYTPGMLREQTVRALYGEQLRLSASRVDRLAACRYRFFLEYGLRAAERRKAEVDPSLYGTFVHYVLEHTVRSVMEQGGFHSVNWEQVQALAQHYIETFTDEQLGGLSGLPERDKYLFRRRWEEVLAVAKDLWEELRQSDFLPVALELEFQNETAIRIHGTRGDSVLTGKVDRVDCYRAADGTDYVRVVDYKTGGKSLNYADVLCGMGLQMLIYLFALETSGKTLLDRDVRSAGVLYFPARHEVLYNKEKPTEKEAQKSRRDSMLRRGLLLNDDEVLNAMEPAAGEPRYLPYKYSSGERTGDLASEAQLALLDRYVRDTLAELTDLLLRGEIAPNPYEHGYSGGCCTYCDYRTVCHVAAGEIPMRELAEVKAKDFWEELERRETAHG